MQCALRGTREPRPTSGQKSVTNHKTLVGPQPETATAVNPASLLQQIHEPVPQLLQKPFLLLLLLLLLLLVLVLVVLLVLLTLVQLLVLLQPTA
jgi:hypothetical protein